MAPDFTVIVVSFTVDVANASLNIAAMDDVAGTFMAFAVGDTEIIAGGVVSLSVPDVPLLQAEIATRPSNRKATVSARLAPGTKALALLSPLTSIIHRQRGDRLKAILTLYSAALREKINLIRN
jgi:hypothetical protein